jgi:glycine/D-amino acid oxidase-like deaminating enzyme
LAERRLRLAQPLWLDQAPAHPRRYPSLRGASAVEVAIVGGGITGAAVAWMFAQAGVSVAVVDAARVARGSTAASTALLMQETDTDFRQLAARYGPARAARMWDLSRGATRSFVRTLRRLRIPCDLERRDSVYFTTRADRAPQLADEFEQRQRQGFGGRWLDAAALKRATGIDGHAAIRTRGNAQVDPCKACSGLLRAAERHGARVFEESVVRRIDTGRRQVELRTGGGGTLRANTVVIATGYATPEFKPLLGRFRLLHTYVVATARLPAATRRRLGLGEVMLWDTERPYHYARWVRGRLLLGGADRPLVAKRARRRALRTGTQAVRDHFTQLYPSLEGARLDYAWEGLFATTPDGLPYIGRHRLYPRHLFALGYGGNGMTFGFLAARLLLEMYAGTDGPDHQLFAFNRARLIRT